MRFLIFLFLLISCGRGNQIQGVSLQELGELEQLQGPEEVASPIGPLEVLSIAARSESGILRRSESREVALPLLAPTTSLPKWQLERAFYRYHYQGESETSLLDELSNGLILLFQDALATQIAESAPESLAIILELKHYDPDVLYTLNFLDVESMELIRAASFPLEEERPGIFKTSFRSKEQWAMDVPSGAIPVLSWDSNRSPQIAEQEERGLSVYQLEGERIDLLELPLYQHFVIEAGTFRVVTSPAEILRAYRQKNIIVKSMNNIERLEMPRLLPLDRVNIQLRFHSEVPAARAQMDYWRQGEQLCYSTNWNLIYREQQVEAPWKLLEEISFLRGAQRLSFLRFLQLEEETYTTSGEGVIEFSFEVTDERSAFHQAFALEFLPETKYKEVTIPEVQSFCGERRVAINPRQTVREAIRLRADVRLRVDGVPRVSP